MPAVAHPESIVETEWVAEHLGDDNLRLVEVDVDLEAYAQGHIPGAIQWDWTSHLNDAVTRDILSKEQMQRLLGESGIVRTTNVVLYGDNNNWFAAYAFWQMKLYGHRRVRIMNGGRQKWINEGSAASTAPPTPTPPSAPQETTSWRWRPQGTASAWSTCDRRGEYSGELLAPPNIPQEGSQRGGHIPGAAHIPWANAVNEEDGTFKSGGRASTALLQPWHYRERRDDRVLPHRRAVLPYLVRSDPDSRVRKGP